MSRTHLPLQALQQAWQQRNPREKKGLALVALLLTLTLLWSLALNPAWRTWQQAPAKQAELDALSAQLAELEVTITATAGDEGKLFGSIGTHDIADALTASGVEVAKAEVRLPNGTIRQVGEYDVAVHLHTDVEATVKVVVVAA